ncbi:hypothetical protein GOP47_0028270, partial [Adiantum capillus-veneris]
MMSMNRKGIMKVAAEDAAGLMQAPHRQHLPLTQRADIITEQEIRRVVKVVISEEEDDKSSRLRTVEYEDDEQASAADLREENDGAMDVKQLIGNITTSKAGDDQDLQARRPPRTKKTAKKRTRDGDPVPTRSSKQKLALKNSSTSSTVAGSAACRNSSKYRGVTRHRWTGRYEAHLWDKNSWNQSQSKKGRQVYLGAYDDEDTAAHAYDLAALKYWGPDTILNFPINKYDKEIDEMQKFSREEYIASLRRKSNGFSRGVSKYRGVARHHHNGRWEARIGRVYGNKYLYLGTYSTQEEAAVAYDIAAIQYRGLNAVTNFDMSNYLRWMKPGGQVLMNIVPCSDKGINVCEDKSASSRKQASAANRFKALTSAEAPQIADTHHHRLAEIGTQAIISDNNLPSFEEIDQHNMMMMMQLENILGSSDYVYGNHIQDQASATCSMPDPSFDGRSQLAAAPGETGQRLVNPLDHSLYLPSASARLSNIVDANEVFDRSPQLTAAHRLDKLMAEYNELLQSSSPKEILEQGTLSAYYMDTLSDTASSSTSSISSAPLHVLNHEYLDHMIKPGGYVAGLLSPQEELIKCVEPIFEMSNMVAGTANDSICSSNDLSSIQELGTCSMSEPASCNNGMYPIHFNSCTPNDPGQ